MSVVDCLFTKYTGPARCFNQFVPDLGLAYLSAVLKQEGYTCELLNLDLPGNSPQDLLDCVARCKPGILAIKLIQVRGSLPTLIEIAKEAKRLSPRTMVIGGGPHVRVCGDVIFELAGVFDALVVGEAGGAITQLVQVAHGERDLGDVENVIFRDKNGSLVKRPVSLVDDLDKLPLPDWGLYDLERYLPVFLISAHRGCPFACAFCNYNYVDGREFTETQVTDDGAVRVVRDVPDRKRTVHSLRQEIRWCIEQYGVRLFALTDSLPDTRQVSELCDWLLDSGARTRWTSFGRVKSMDRLFAKMARAGWVSLWFGIESGSERVLKRMNKFYSAEDIQHTVAAAKEAGIGCTGGFIVGFPGEDESTFAETLELAQALSLDGVIFAPYELVPGSLVAQVPEAYDIRLHDDWMRKYCRISGEERYDILYFDVEGEDNAGRFERFRPLLDGVSADFSRYQVDDLDYAQLIASIMEGDVDDVLAANACLSSGDFAGWDAFLSKAWCAAENFS